MLFDIYLSPIEMQPQEHIEVCRAVTMQRPRDNQVYQSRS
jgi:hypothetical protein